MNVLNDWMAGVEQTGDKTRGEDLWQSFMAVKSIFSLVAWDCSADSRWVFRGFGHCCAASSGCTAHL